MTTLQEKSDAKNLLRCGMRRKGFELVLVQLLEASCQDSAALRRPCFVKLSSFDAACLDNSCCSLSLRLDKLNKAARVYGNLPGQLSQPERAKRKDEQIQSLLRCILPLVPSRVTVDSLNEKEKIVNIEQNNKVKQENTSNNERPFTIVDFGGGSGFLAVPLALLLPHCRVIVVDLNKNSLDLLHQKAEMCAQVDTAAISEATFDDHDRRKNNIKFINSSQHQQTQQMSVKDKFRSNITRQSQAIPNLYTFHGPLQDFDEPFDLAVALHLCGEATDACLRKACDMPSCCAVVVAPCCVGKINQARGNPQVWQATGSSASVIDYPQSQAFKSCNLTAYDWNALVQAADYGSMKEFRSSRNAARRTAKAMLEQDRCLLLQDYGNFSTLLTRMEPWEASPKNDIIVAWRKELYKNNQPNVNACIDDECMRDLHTTIDFLLHTSTVKETEDDTQVKMVDWTLAEEAKILDQLQTFVASDESHVVFPTRMPSRLRKCVHYLADKLDLSHKSYGQKYADKTVFVAKKTST